MPVKIPLLELPNEQTLQILTSVLDWIDDKILIIDKRGQFIFYNEKYIEYYGEQLEKFEHITVEELYQKNLYQLNGKEVGTLDAILKSPKVINKLFSQSGKKISHNVFTDIYPIFIADEFFGLAIVEHNTELIVSLNNQLNYYKSLSNNLKQKLFNKTELPEAFQHVAGDSVQMLRVLNMCAHVAPTQSSVCLLGESGTGKEVLAEAIHTSSNNVSGPMIKVNCAAIPETLMESELFGYEKGAFTGANPHGSVGKFELANGGTLFLDEIGEMPMAMQAKLLRAIQEREITRIGGSKTIKLNFRLITATNRDLEEMVKKGEFREDLYYRICVIPIHLPPLRDRRSDIPLLAGQFLRSLETNPNRLRIFSDEVLNQFMEYNWPGNIRELKNCVERMAILCSDDCIGAEYLPPNIMKSVFPNQSRHREGQYNLHEIMEKVEYDTIKTVLSLTKGNKSKAIDMLGISKRNFYMKLEKYHLK